VLILSSFLSSRFAEDRPFSLNASIVFEQSYAGIEGDSASTAELYALLSALSEVPIRQGLAVTGSVNQHGQVQAIGGVNQKIEGFFDIVKARGLTGEQGVLIPESNVKNLMLREDVREAVAAGEFHVYPVSHVDEGIQILTGVPAGEAGEEGEYPEGTINARIVERLEQVAKKARNYGRPPREAEEAKEEDKAQPEEEDVPDEIPKRYPIDDEDDQEDDDGEPETSSTE
jgi:predicted ATP-dependent protease